MMEIHPSHKGTNYMKRPVRKKKKKRKKSKNNGGAGGVFIPED